MYTTLLTRLPARRALATVHQGTAVRAFASKSRSSKGSKSQQPSQPSPSSSDSTPPAQEQANAQPSPPIQPLRSLDFETTLADLPSLSAGQGQGDGSEPQERERTGAKSSKDSLSSIEKKRKVLGRITFAAMLLALGAEGFWLGREWTGEELKEKKLTLETAPSSRWDRTKTRFWDMFGVFSEPQWPQLLPDPYPPPMGKPYTLLISLEDLLIWSTWDRKTGWKTAKRPGVDYFIAYLSQFYELVIFTTMPSYVGAQIVQKLDPYNMFFTFQLFREGTRVVDGEAVKDLSFLNRPLNKVIILDAHPEHVKTHPENAIVLNPWKGEIGDKGLIGMVPFLESIGIYRPDDVRPILQAYAGKDIPIEYAKKEAEAKQKHIEEWKERHKGGLSTGGFTLSGLFGGSAPAASPIPPTYLEQKRAEAQALYREEQAYIRAHKDEFERLLEEDKNRMAKEMSGSLWGAMGLIGDKKDGAAAGGEVVPVSEGTSGTAAKS
ncbi:hypothetical protein JAAARDRAFT_36623 [Jaapia argillacea MUCL 33604]|uniref:Mitochondrial import inner membrane translocase subunit TIM50 n=1 Tax=Jaapia argillacea MUCL 33604 TaxID=933084 RepID=A0A067PYZ3_9AGAM|nr:hypothetical protein JAAARDRAFT_36623 [Jaapia argillacea MUCL 33604]